MSEVSRSRRISSKNVQTEIIYTVIGKIFTAGKIFVTNVQGANLKILCTAFCYNFCQLIILKIKIMNQNRKNQIKYKIREKDL
jgi:IS5 family transposase